MTKLLGVIAIAAVAFAVAPAQAAKHAMGGCSGPNLEKTETAIENMADGDSKWVAEKEITAAQDALMARRLWELSETLTGVAFPALTDTGAVPPARSAA